LDILCRRRTGIILLKYNGGQPEPEFSFVLRNRMDEMKRRLCASFRLGDLSVAED